MKMLTFVGWWALATSRGQLLKSIGGLSSTHITFTHISKHKIKLLLTTQLTLNHR